MTPTYVALDLETTGLDPTTDAITEIAAVRFDGGGAVVDEFQALVNPGRPIPRVVQEMTGIVDADVAGAPRVGELLEAITAFIGDGPIVGHNVGFDLAFLARAGASFNVPAVDTAELSRLLLPDRTSRGLSELAGQLGIEVGTVHRAASDARLAARLFLALRGRAAALDPGVRLQLARLVSIHDLTLAGVLAGDEWRDLPPAERAAPLVKSAASLPALARREPRVPVLPAETRRVFEAATAPGEGLEWRGEQVQVAETITGALSGGGHWLIEAGTGVGKSLAYLAPAALFALRNGERVVVSTNTLNLQEQLLHKDVPALRRVLRAAGVISAEEDLRVSVLKGRGNYLCLRRWTASYGASLADPDFTRLAASLLLWLPETDTGDRAELNLGQAEWQAWARFSAQDTDCLSRPNAFVKEGLCFLQRARKAAEAAHILIVNHALLLADIASGGSALPPFDHLIVDEAHNLEDQATQQFGGSVSRRTVHDALDGIHRRAGRDQREGGVVALLKALPEGGARMAGQALESSAAEAAAAVTPCFEVLRHELATGQPDDRLHVTRAVRARPSWAAVELAWERLDRALRMVVTRAEQAAHVVNDTAAVEGVDVLAAEIESAARKVEELRGLHARLMSEPDPMTVVWAAPERDGTASLNAAPLEVGPVLWERLFMKKRTVVATSATLATAGSMEFTARRLGLEGPASLQVGSPFDYERSTLLAAVTDLPEPGSPAFPAEAGRALVELVLAAGGRTLALFTSHADLRRAADAVRSMLEAEGIAVLAQGIDGPPRQLVDNLLANPRAVILGTSSFWEGVDIRGDALSQLVIVRLPFSVPSDPVFKARSEQYDDAFGEYALPAAILRFRQGFGRLIRDRADRGVVVVLDRRIFERRYGSEFLRALPQCSRLRASTAVVAQAARDWLA